MDYWNECISEACEDAKVTATSEQIATIAYWVEGAHENYSMAHGHDCIPNPLLQENEELKRKMKTEIDRMDESCRVDIALHRERIRSLLRENDRLREKLDDCPGKT